LPSFRAAVTLHESLAVQSQIETVDRGGGLLAAADPASGCGWLPFI